MYVSRQFKLDSIIGYTEPITLSNTDYSQTYNTIILLSMMGSGKGRRDDGRSFHAFALQKAIVRTVTVQSTSSPARRMRTPAGVRWWISFLIGRRLCPGALDVGHHN